MFKDPIVLILIAANVIVSMQGFKDYSFIDKYKFQIAPIKAGEKIRMLTSGFLHVDMTHLLFNMITLYFFAPAVLAYMGTPKFLGIYFGSLLAGSLFAMIIHKNEPMYSAVGASGAVMGVIYAAIMLNPDMNLYLFFIPIPIPGYVFGIGYLLYSVFGMKNSWGNIGHSAHIGGAIGGYLLTILFIPEVITAHWKLTLLLGVPIILLIIFRDRLTR